MCKIFRDIWLLKVPRELLDRDFCEKAVSHTGRNIRVVPDSILDEKLCVLALENGASIDDIEEKFWSGAVLSAAAARGSLAGIAPDKITYEMARTAVEIDPQELRRCPLALRDETLYCLALRQNANLFSLVPENERTYAIYLALMHGDGGRLCEVPKEMRDFGMCEVAVSSCPDAYAFIPIAIRKMPEAKEWAIKAVGANWYNRRSLNEVPHEIRNDVLVEVYRRACEEGKQGDDVDSEAFRLHPLSLLRVSEKYWHSDVVLEYMRYAPKHLWYFRSKFNRDICFESVKRCGYTIRYVPEEFIDDEMIRAAIDVDAHFAQCLPRNREFAEIAVRHNGRALKWIHRELVDEELRQISLTNPDPEKILPVSEFPYWCQC